MLTLGKAGQKPVGLATTIYIQLPFCLANHCPSGVSLFVETVEYGVHTFVIGTLLSALKRRVSVRVRVRVLPYIYTHTPYSTYINTHNRRYIFYSTIFAFTFSLSLFGMCAALLDFINIVLPLVGGLSSLIE